MTGTDDGKAILKKFLSIESLVSYLYAFYESVNLSENTVFEIQPIQSSVVLELAASQDNDLLKKYFDQQARMLSQKKPRIAVLHDKQKPVKSKKEYMREYMRLKRQNVAFKAHERKWKQGSKNVNVNRN